LPANKIRSLKSRTTVIITVSLALALCASIVRYHFWKARYAYGGGRHEISPDKRFAAGAMSMVDQNFFGLTRCYYDFSVTVGDPSLRADAPIVARQIISASSQTMIAWREQGTIEWSPDSSQVTFLFEKSRLTLKVAK
jgi:hypothetical protein